MWRLLLCDDELKLNKLLVLRNSRRYGGERGGGLGRGSYLCCSKLTSSSSPAGRQLLSPLVDYR